MARVNNPITNLPFQLKLAEHYLAMKRHEESEHLFEEVIAKMKVQGTQRNTLKKDEIGLDRNWVLRPVPESKTSAEETGQSAALTIALPSSDSVRWF